MKTIGVLVFEGVQSLDVSGPLDVFAETNAIVGSDKGYSLTLIGPGRGPFAASNGMLLAADVDYSEATGPFDLFLVAGGPELPTGEASREIIECILRLSAASAVYGSICTGAFLLGAAGLLNGRRVTTHWQNARQLAARFPKADVDFDKIFLRDDRLITSAGVTAGIDLALALVREDHGSAISLAVAKRLVVVAQRLGGQSQFSPYVEIPTDAASPISSITSYVMENLDHALSVAELAATVSMSERTFARAFASATGSTPAQFVEQARVDAARALLEGTAKPLKVIAHECGFGNPKRMREVFLKRLGVLPTQYRNQFLIR
ncbi:AraC family transcriptional regulator (plasmid) [Rhizobium leguminosarum bv. viciae]|uniref:GlxA family transcriptional regulator n=1 Tax=Rhizobium leguminosarum TaxID=384 RepID=UPI000B8D11C7|nr:DJ-1/PfpI family protein [Rhizobium leguminosarum]ASR10067.1 AraC family transcriptional regulator [Rhizobium leguminosarum bv. viciae]